MCRLEAYLGPPISLAKALTAPAHSLVHQSYQPREMTAGVVNADGFGVAWYDGRSDRPYRYRTTLPVWSDVNLDDLARYAESGCLLAYVRSATPGQGLDMANTQPFVHGAWSFVHNGFIDGFSGEEGVALRRGLQERLDDAHWPLAGGGTDSGLIFAWVMQHLSAAPAEAAIPAALAELSAMPGLSRVGLNFLISDGHRGAAVRHAIGTDCPSLYIIRDHAEYSGGVIVASEPLFEADWAALPANSLTLIDPDLPADDLARHASISLAA